MPPADSGLLALMRSFHFPCEINQYRGQDKVELHRRRTKDAPFSKPEEPTRPDQFEHPWTLYHPHFTHNISK